MRPGVNETRALARVINKEMMMTISTIIRDSANAVLPEEERKIPWDEPAFSQRMLENHLSQEHDWAWRSPKER